MAGCLVAAVAGFRHTISGVLCSGISTTGARILTIIFGKDISDFCIRIIVGFHGKPATFNESVLEVLESNGTAVEPESLFDVQLELRLGTLPDWVKDLRTEWEMIRSIPLTISESKTSGIGLTVDSKVVSLSPNIYSCY